MGLRIAMMRSRVDGEMAGALAMVAAIASL